MGNLKLRTLQEVFEYYGRENLVAIDNLAQIIFYTSHGYQPKYVCENELKKGRMTAWYLKEESKPVYKKWIDSHSR